MVGFQIVGLLIGLIVAVLLILGLREVVLWYWRIADIVTELRAIRAELEQMRTRGAGAPGRSDSLTGDGEP